MSESDYIIKEISSLEDLLLFYPVLLQLFDFLSLEGIKKSAPKLFDKGFFFAGLYRDGLPVGLVQWHVDINLENYKYIVIDELVVDKTYRGQGYGTKLLRYIEARAKNFRIDGIGLLSGINRIEAHNFYEKNGFEYRSKWFVKKLKN